MEILSEFGTETMDQNMYEEPEDGRPPRPNVIAAFPRRPSRD